MYTRSGTLIQRKFREYLIPTIITVVAIMVGNIVNSIIVGNFLSEKGLSALALSMPIFFTVNAMYTLFAIGGAIYTSIALGQLDKNKANTIFSVTFISGFTITLLFAFIMMIFMSSIANYLAHGNTDLAKMVQEYLTFLVFTCPILMLVQGMSYFIRTDGIPRLAANIIIVSNFASLLLTYIFVKHLELGMRGAGLGSLLGNGLGIFMLIFYFISKQRSLSFIIPKKSDFGLLKNIISLGSPKAVLFGLSFLRTFTLNTIIMKTLGIPGMVSMSICLNAFMFAKICVSGTTDTLLPIVATLLGEKDYRGIRFSANIGFRFMIAICTIISLIFLIMPELIGRMFGVQSEESMVVLNTALRMYALSIPLYAINTLLHNFYQATGRIKLANLIIFMNVFGFISIFGVLLGLIKGSLIWLSFILAEIASLLLIIIISKYIRKKENVNSLLLIPSEAEDTKIDISIPATIESALGVRDKIMAFCNENKIDNTTSLKIGIAVEEITVNIAKYGHKKNIGEIDILLRFTKDELILRIRDDGIYFNPTLYQPGNDENIITGLEIVKKLIKNIVYIRQIGFNVNIIILEIASVGNAFIRS